MLQEVRIRDLGVIEDAVLALSPGLTVLTGETGAGKTMVVTALGLLLGARGDAGAVRTGAARTSVEGRVVVSDGSAAAERTREAGGDLDDGELIIGRSVGAEGRSRAYLGGRSVPVSVLGELADDLVAVHGQSDQHRLLRPARQREMLDRYAGAAVTKPLTAYRAAWHGLRELEQRLEALVAQASNRAQEAELLRFGLAQVEALNPLPGEDVVLRVEESRLSHAETLQAAASSAHAALTGAPDDDTGEQAADAATLVDIARRSVDAARVHDEGLTTVVERLAEVGYLLADVAGDLAHYIASVDVDPTRLAAVQERRAALTGLTRAHGPDVDALLTWVDGASARLLELENDSDVVTALREQQASLRAELGGLAGTLRKARVAAGLRLGAAVTAELSALAMGRATVEMAVTNRTGEGPGAVEVDGVSLLAGPYGVDEVELLLAANAGAGPRPLAKSASGGELSRVMLALEVVLAGSDPVPTFVFDEVDAGVGGAAALEVGRRLAQLARTAQVIVVTHLAQVAVFADEHLVVVKDASGSVTSSGVARLDEGERLRELSRMLGGRADSDAAQAHARELLASARASAP